MKRSRMLGAVIGALLPLAAVSLLQADVLDKTSPESASPVSPAAGSGILTPGSTYRLAPEDLIRVRVARHPDLGGEVVVLQDGRVTLPVVGAIPVTGLTIEQLRDRITQGLRQRLVSPEVSVEVIRPRPLRIFVSGAVRSPQTLDWKEGWRITEALANAGGLGVKPEVARGTLFRVDQTIKLDLAQIYIRQDSAANLALQPGDVLDIQEQPIERIYVSGQVANPGLYDLSRGRGVIEALALAKGPTPTAALSKSYVVKMDGRKIPVDLSLLINNGPEAVLGSRSSIGLPTAAEEKISPKTEEGDKTVPSTVTNQAAVPNAVTTSIAGTPSPANIQLEAGDQLVVPENMTKIAVFGKVMQPHSFPLKDGGQMTAVDAISMAGGFDRRAEKSSVGIIRMVDGKHTVITVDMNRFVKGKEMNPTLQDRDIVFVPESRQPDWLGKVLPAVQSLTGVFWYILGGNR